MVRVLRDVVTVATAEDHAHVGLWDAAAGGLRWDMAVRRGATLGAVGALAVSPDSTEDMRGALLVFDADLLTLLHASTGKQLWSVAAPGGGVRSVSESVASRTLIVVTDARTFAVRVADGKVSRQYDITGRFPPVSVGGMTGSLACAAGGAVTLTRAAFNEGGAGGTCAGTVVAALPEFTFVDVEGVGLVRFPSAAAAAGAEGAGRVLAPPGAGYGVGPDGSVLVEGRRAADSTELAATVWSAGDEREVAITIPVEEHDAGTRAWLVAGGLALRVTGDDTLQAYALPAAGAAHWVREESLADARFVEFFHHPFVESDPLEVPDVTALAAGAYARFLAAVRLRCGLLDEFLGHLGVESHLQALVPASAPPADAVSSARFGYEKTIVLATGSGRVVAVSSVDGGVVWSRRLHGGAEVLALTAYGGTDEAGLPRNAVVAWVDPATGRRYLTVLDAFTGAIVEGHPVDFALERFLNLPSAGPLLAVAEDLSLHAVLGTSSSYVAELPRLHPFLVDAARGLVIGYDYEAGSDHPRETWRVAFSQGGGEPERIVRAVALPVADMHLRGPPPAAHVGADGTPLPPYLNANVVFVATEAHRGRHFQHLLQVYLLDAATGAVLYSTYHPDARGPVSVAHDQHWFVYSFWHTQHRRHELTTVELFEQAPSPFRAPVTGLARSYLLDVPVVMAGVTRTAHAVTTRQVLLATRTGELYGLNFNFLSARRPDAANVTNAHREQMLPPYDPRLPLGPAQLLSANRTVLGVEGIASAPTRVESSSVVLAYGHDLYFTITAPSKTFDLLEADFNYALLALTVVTVLFAVRVFSSLVQQRALEKAWK